MRSKEKQTEGAVVLWANANGWRNYKLSGLGEKGKPDRVFLHHPKLTVFIEFKKPGEPPTKLQLWHQSNLMQMGFTCLITDSAEEAINLLNTTGEPYGG